MRQWWDDRAPRERALLTGLGALFGLLMFYQFIARPLVNYRRAAGETYAAAVGALAEVEAGAAGLQRLRAAAAPQTDVPVRTLASAVAVDLGVPITRLQPAENGTLDVWFDDVATPQLFTWIARLQEKGGAAVLRAVIQKNDGATVRAQITLAERPSP